MQPEAMALLYDVSNAILEIEGYFVNQPMRFDAYLADSHTRRTVERNIEIIGEAINRLLKLTPDVEISNTKKIIGMRNRITHGYDTVSDEMVWSVVINHLPILKNEIERLIKPNDNF